MPCCRGEYSNKCWCFCAQALHGSAEWCSCCRDLTQCHSQNNTSDLSHYAHLNHLQWQWLVFLLLFIKYIRVLPPGGQCYEEGPFFPTTPRYAVQVGIARKQDLLLKPDWTAIIGVITGLLTLLITCVVLTVSNSYTKSLLERFCAVNPIATCFLRHAL